MSNEPPAPSTLRQPFSLRELFCLTTLAGLSLALILGFAWTNDERWLLGLTLGGSLLGIAIARTFKRRGWLVGILGGTLGGLIGAGIFWQDCQAGLDELATVGSWTASQLAELRIQYLWAAATTAVLGVVLALLGVACFRLLVWSTDVSLHGLISATRRHPYRAAAILMMFASLIAVIANIDFLLDPQAWAPRHFIPLTPLNNSGYSNHGLSTVRTGSLSRSGDWLLIESYMPGIGREVAKKEMYRLDPRPHVVSFADRPERASFVTFDCTENRVLFLEWLGEFYYDRPEQTHHLRIVDLDRLTSVTLTEKPVSADVHSLQWLPDGGLVIHYGDEWNGKKGHTRLQPRKETGQWARQESDVVTEFDARSGTAVEFNTEGMRIVDLKSSREVASFPQEWLAENMFGDSSRRFKLSPDTRFMLAGNKIYDRESRTVRDWRTDERFWFFRDFTSRGFAVYHAAPVAWHADFLTDVPFINRFVDWLQREPIRLIDPAKALEVAHTRPLRDPITFTITLSPDGSRMAVFTNDGVYVYDVPAKYR